MWQKFVAGACVMTGALGFGWSLCREMSSDIQHLKLQKQILIYMIGEITYLHRPMEEIFDIIAEKILPPYDVILSDISHKMKEREGKPLPSLWRETICSLHGKTQISENVLAYLEKMGDCFVCEGDRMQVGTLELFEAELEREIDRLTAKKDENSRLIKALSTLTGILCIILFL